MVIYQKVKKQISEKIQKLRISIEPFGFLFVTATIMQSVPKQNLLFYKVCGGQCGFDNNTSDCYGSNQTDLLAKQNISTDQLGSYTHQLNLYGTLIDHLLSAFFVLLFGPLSNQYGRKFLMVAVVIGHMISTFILMTHSLIDWLPAEFILLADVSVGLFGGRVTFVMAVNNYIADITTEEMRTVRLAIMAGVIAMAVQISSQLISPVVYNQGGDLAIWLVALVFYGLSLIDLFFFVPESRGKSGRSRFARLIVIKSNSGQQVEQTIRESLFQKSICQAFLKNLWQWSTITFQQRKGYGRILIFSLIICLFFNLFSYAHYGVAYLYTRHTFCWDHSDFTLYTACYSLAQILGALLILPFLSDFLRWSDTFIGILSSSGNGLSYLWIALATSSAMIYLSTLGRILSLAMTVVIRSMLSKLVEADQVSYVYAFVACLESIVPLIAIIGFDSLYKASLHWYPGMVFLIEMTIEVILTIAFVGVIMYQKKEKANRVRPATSYYLSPLKRLPR